ncbi:probable 2-oxoglutarate-dependent dioxygenase ANS [Selaginella moellendorffii]|uniref:probable 2-oxoglutarate-dependent dioxygenase ANS n=1 Tax=Selaginella moellendorffii TaxID=88036 RepID=UPI000D1C69EC|nr:probable 2-oxoglutarate-dependent dioxygenase ANS [Selaginella moellendorffii]|eukprot:XP_024542456.1 probable 2-oxoglutarate-dependent dioxygenase ANS [Selaginella moellendorffii]
MAAGWNKLDGAKALVDSGIDGVPDFYVKPLDQRLSPQDLELHAGEQEDEVPVIDVSPLLDSKPTSSDRSKEDVIAELLDASERWGFFQVINHGIGSDLTRRMLAVAHEFFQLPLAEKMVFYSTDIDAAVRYGTSFNPLKDVFLDWQDNLLHRFLPERRDQPHPWPTKPSAYELIAGEFVDQAKFLARHLLRALSEGLGLGPDYLEGEFGEHNVALRLNYYPPCPSPELAIGLSSHSDVGGLTILLQDSDIVGLQVKVQEKWKTVRSVPGALVINIGDQLQIYSNGKLKSVEHRAIVNADKARVSVGLFYDPASDVRVSPIPKFVDTEHPAAYNPCVFREYLKNLYSKNLVGKELLESQRK